MSANIRILDDSELNMVSGAYQSAALSAVSPKKSFVPWGCWNMMPTASNASGGLRYGYAKASVCDPVPVETVPTELLPFV